MLFVTEAKCSEAHARRVLLGPTRWAILAFSVDWFFSVFAKAKLGKAFTRVVSGGIEALSRPTRIAWAFAIGCGATRANCGTRTCGGQLWRRFAEADGREAIASLVFGCPTRGALLSRRVNWLFASLAKAQFGKAFAGVIARMVEIFAWPAAFVALARRRCAARANGRALARLWKLLGGIAEADCCKAIASLVLLWPARWALLTRSVDRLLTCLAKPQLCEALASRIRCVIQAAPRPT